MTTINILVTGGSLLNSSLNSRVMTVGGRSVRLL